MRLRRKISIAIVVLLAIPVLYGVSLHYRLKRAVEDYKRQLRAQGERLTIPELTPLVPTNGQNGAGELIACAGRVGGYPAYTPGAMKYITNGHARVAWQQMELLSSEGTNVWPFLAREFEEREDAYAGMREALEKPVLHFQLDYSRGFDLLLPHLRFVKQAAQWLSAATIFDLHEGQTTNAWEDLRACTALAQHYSDEPVLISQLVSLAIRQISLSAAWEALQSPDWRDDQLMELQHAWESKNPLAQMEPSAEMERVMDDQLYSEFRESYAAIKTVVDSLTGGVTANTNLITVSDAVDKGKEIWNDPKEALNIVRGSYLGYLAWKWWWSYDGQLAALKMWQADLDAFRAARTNGSFVTALRQLDAEADRIRAEHPSAGRWFDALFYPCCDNTFYRSALLKAANMEMERRLLVTAIALKRNQLRHGNFPSDLTALVPDFLEKPPIDFMDGKPLRYRVKDDGSYLLYSVGEDGEDNGGYPSRTNSGNQSWYYKRRDVVWPTPATPEEVRLDNEQLIARAKRSSSDLPPTPISEGIINLVEKGASVNTNAPATATNANK